MLQLRSYGKAELALLYHPCSTPKTAMKTLYRWIKGCPMLMSEQESMNYNPNRRMFLRSEVEAIVRHLGGSRDGRFPEVSRRIVIITVRLSCFFFIFAFINNL